MTSPRTVEQLEDLLSEPSPGAVETLRGLPGDLLLLGVGGKMGPTLARMARRASDTAGTKRRVIGASRFSEPGLEDRLRAAGVETIRCDLLDAAQLDKLPDCPNILYMVGFKFGTTGGEHLTWAMNAFLPGLVGRKFRRSKIVAFSTGNVYPLSPPAHGGCRETDPIGPVGEYAMSALGRERMFEYVSRTFGVPTAVLRLNYATELRYGVLVDIARKVWEGRPVELHMGCLNAVWQADANAVALRAFELVSSPPFVLNIAGPETISVRKTAEEFGRLMGKPATFEGAEAPDALLSNGALAHRLFGYPRVGAGQMVKWIAEWVMHGGASLGKPTHFEVRDGKF
jgi:nucleoside-diphosphate-sugar epimerase